MTKHSILILIRLHTHTDRQSLTKHYTDTDHTQEDEQSLTKHLILIILIRIHIQEDGQSLTKHSILMLIRIHIKDDGQSLTKNSILMLIRIHIHIQEDGPLMVKPIILLELELLAPNISLEVEPKLSSSILFWQSQSLELLGSDLF